MAPNRVTGGRNPLKILSVSVVTATREVPKSRISWKIQAREEEKPCCSPPILHFYLLCSSSLCSFLVREDWTLNEIKKKKYVKYIANHDLILAKARVCRNRRDASIATRQIKVQESRGTVMNTEIRQRGGLDLGTAENFLWLRLFNPLCCQVSS